MIKDTRFPRSDRQTLEGKLPPGTLDDAQAWGVWNFLIQSDDPSNVSQIYRSYRDSDRCTLPREKLRAMRDVMVNDMREQNKLSKKPRVQTQIGNNTPGYNDGRQSPRKGA